MNARLICPGCFKLRSLMLLGALIAGVGFTSAVSAQQEQKKSAFFIDTISKTWIALTKPGFESEATDINNAGQVVGHFTRESTHSATRDNPGFVIRIPFVTGPNGIGITDLDTSLGEGSHVSGINDAGQMIGSGRIKTFSSNGFITGPNGEGVRSFGEQGVELGQAINNSGQVTGISANVLGFITGPNGEGLRELNYVDLEGIGPPGAQISFSYANALNDTGQVAGTVYWGGGSRIRGFITGPDGEGMTALGLLDGAFYTFANGINEAGQVVGSSARNSYDEQRAFITGPNGNGMVELGEATRYAGDINDAGQVVGHLVTAEGERHAFITGPNGEGLTDLNSLLDFPDGMVLASATGINNNGQVIAIGFIPEPESYALLLAGLGLLGFVTRRKSSRKPWPERLCVMSTTSVDRKNYLIFSSKRS